MIHNDKGKKKNWFAYPPEKRGCNVVVAVFPTSWKEKIPFAFPLVYVCLFLEIFQNPNLSIAQPDQQSTRRFVDVHANNLIQGERRWEFHIPRRR